MKSEISFNYKKVYPSLNIIGNIPNNNGAEESQFKRVLEILNDNSQRFGPWNIVLLDQKFHHEKGEIIDKDVSWDGQIDLLLLSQNKIIIYELKGFTTELIGATTSNKKWLVKNKKKDHRIKMKSPFIQSSKQRSFLMDDIFRKAKSDNNHWVIDSRVVFKNNSSFDGFWYFPPSTITQECFYKKYLDKIVEPKYRETLLNYYSEIEQSTGKMKLRNLSSKEIDIIRKIFAIYSLPIRTRNWFKLLTENQIIKDISSAGSDRFNLDRNTAEAVIDKLMQKVVV